MPECPNLAKKQSSDHARDTTAHAPATDIRLPNSAFALIWSGLPPGTDLPGGAAIRPGLTPSRHSGDKVRRLQVSRIPVFYASARCTWRGLNRPSCHPRLWLWCRATNVRSARRGNAP
jgi:hypothetical protein